jgi:hypothetical protein
MTIEPDLQGKVQGATGANGCGLIDQILGRDETGAARRVAFDVSISPRYNIRASV